MKKFATSRFKSVSYVLKGMFFLLKTEDAIKAQFIFFIIFTVLGIYFQISIEDWKWQLLCFGLIFTAESLNTGIEKLCDFTHPDFDKKIGFIKDVSAGASGFAALFSLIICILIYSKYV